MEWSVLSGRTASWQNAKDVGVLLHQAYPIFDPRIFRRLMKDHIAIQMENVLRFMIMKLSNWRVDRITPKAVCLYIGFSKVDFRYLRTSLGEEQRLRSQMNGISLFPPIFQGLGKSWLFQSPSQDSVRIGRVDYNLGFAVGLFTMAQRPGKVTFMKDASERATKIKQDTEGKALIL